MTRVAYVDPVGGAAGDMLLAALVDAGAKLSDVQLSINLVLPGPVTLSTTRVQRGGLHAQLLQAQVQFAQTLPSFRRMIDLVERAGLPPRIARTALDILRRLGKAEAQVHGVPLEDLTLHELGHSDTLIDAVGVAAAMDSLAIEQLLVGPVPLATGAMIASDHGLLPLPAPVTIELLRGFRVFGRGSDETVTPTAAAIFAATGAPADHLPDLLLESVGNGAGARDGGETPNVVRVIVGTPVAAGGRDAYGRGLLILETNLDDLSPELVADAADALRAAGALDTWTTPVQMKKGRPGVILSALCPPDSEAVIRHAFFETTSTFGVRSHVVHRFELERQTIHLSLPAGEVRVKVGRLNGTLISVKPEHDDVAALARAAHLPTRMVHDEAMALARKEAAAASKNGSDTAE